MRTTLGSNLIALIFSVNRGFKNANQTCYGDFEQVTRQRKAIGVFANKTKLAIMTPIAPRCPLIRDTQQIIQ